MIRIFKILVSDCEFLVILSIILREPLQKKYKQNFQWFPKNGKNFVCYLPYLRKNKIEPNNYLHPMFPQEELHVQKCENLCYLFFIFPKNVIESELDEILF